MTRRQRKVALIVHIALSVGRLGVSMVILTLAIALITPWGPVRYRWVPTKLITTTIAVSLSLLALPAQTGVAHSSAPAGDQAAEHHGAGVRLLIASCVSVGVYLSSPPCPCSNRRDSRGTQDARRRNGVAGGESRTTGVGRNGT